MSVVVAEESWYQKLSFSGNVAGIYRSLKLLIFGCALPMLFFDESIT